jgi:hypothetical protein
MLIIDKTNIEHFTKVTNFAASTKQAEFLWTQLLYLHHWRDPQVSETRKYWCKTCDFGYVAGADFTVVPSCPSCQVGRPAMWSSIREKDGAVLQGATASATCCRLTYDSAPASFSFALYGWSEDKKDWIFTFNGGLIYHGNQAGWETRGGYVIKNGEGIDTFSVRLGDDPNPWSVHT